MDQVILGSERFLAYNDEYKDLKVLIASLSRRVGQDRNCH